MALSADDVHVEHIHSGLLDVLTDTVEREPTILGARAGMGARTIAGALRTRTGGLELDPVAGGQDPDRILRALTTEVIASTTSLPISALTVSGRDSDSARLQLGRRYRRDLGTALAIAEAVEQQLPEDWTLVRALGDTEEETLVVTDAHLLPTPFLWELRETPIRLLLVTIPEQREALNGEHAPFYGMSAYIEMPTAPLQKWTRTLSPEIPAEELGWLLRHLRYRTASALQVIHRHAGAGDRARPLAHAYFDTVHDLEDRARQILQLARSIHELAPRLLVRLATREPPYGGGRDRPDTVARVLRGLAHHGLVEQPQPRAWQIADPLISDAIEHVARGRHHVDVISMNEGDDGDTI